MLTHLTYGRKNREIADALGVKERTVRFHVENILNKLGVINRTEAACFAFKEGWLEKDDAIVTRTGV